MMGAHDIDRFLDSSTFGDDVFDDQTFFARRDGEAAAKDEFALFFFDKDEAQAKLAGDFLADDEPAHRRSDHGGGAGAAGFRAEGRAEAFHGRHVLQRQGALEELAAVQAAAENEMSFQERARLAKEL